MTIQQRRQQLLQLYHTALASVKGEMATARFLQQHPFAAECSMVAIGKAAASMALGAQGILGAKLRSGLVLTKYGHGEPGLDATRIRTLESAHPVPDASSFASGEALLDFLEQLPEGEPLLFLLSGGASSLVEVLPAGMSESQLATVNDWLLASGLPIGAMNAIRKRLSAIKGGRLIPHLRGRRCLQLMISDVPGDEPEVIGSGPLLPRSHNEVLPSGLPDWLQQLLQQSQAGEDSGSAQIETHIIADNRIARGALAVAAEGLGLTVTDYPECLQGDAEELAAQFCNTLIDAPPGLYLWGGESSVMLPENPGRGGRNQHLALAMARYLAGHDNILFLAAGTDGTDGPTEDAGAMVDGGTLQRGEWEGLCATSALEMADAGSFLEVSGDLVQTGPTGTNVMDLAVAWKW